jgi:hypothetical protein
VGSGDVTRVARRVAGVILSRDGVEFAGFVALVFGAYLVHEIAGVFAAAGVLLWYGNTRGGT